MISLIRGSIRDFRDQAHTGRPLHELESYDWVRFEPVDGGWPDWLWTRDNGTLTSEDLASIRADMSSQGADESTLIQAPAGDVPIGDLPRHLILVKEKTR